MLSDAHAKSAAHPVAFIAKRLRRSALLLACTLPIVPQVVAIGGIVGYLTFRNAEQAIGDLASQLMAELGQRSDLNLSILLNDPERISRANAALVGAGKLDPADQSALLTRFADQLAEFPRVNTVAIASEGRDFNALERDEESLILRTFDKRSGDFINSRLNEQLQPGATPSVLNNYDPHNDPPQDPWYPIAKTQRVSYWFFASSVAKGIENPESSG